MDIEEVAGLQQLGLGVVALHEQDAVLHVAIRRDDDEQHALVGQADEFDLAEYLGALGREHHPGELGQVGQQRGGGIDGPVGSAADSISPMLRGSSWYDCTASRESTNMR